VGQHVVVAAFALMTTYFALAVAKPSVLMLGPDGLTHQGPLGTSHYDWSDLETFLVYRQRLAQPAAILSKTCKKDRPWSRLNALFTGSRLITFGASWEMPPADIVQFLNDAREKWR
jgi:hypothetical protein